MPSLYLQLTQLQTKVRDKIQRSRELAGEILFHSKDAEAQLQRLMRLVTKETGREVLRPQISD